MPLGVNDDAPLEGEHLPGAHPFATFETMPSDDETALTIYKLEE